MNIRVNDVRRANGRITVRFTLYDDPQDIRGGTEFGLGFDSEADLRAFVQRPLRDEDLIWFTLRDWMKSDPEMLDFAKMTRRHAETVLGGVMLR